jgi:hypothetical protein
MSINPSAYLTRLLADDRIREVEIGRGDGRFGLSKTVSEPAPAGVVVTRKRPAHFVALTGAGRIDALLAQGGVKLADALEKRGSINVNNARVGPSDGSVPLMPAAGLKTVDPSDVTIAMPAEDGDPAVSDADRDAWNKFRVTYEATIEAPPYKVRGTLILLPSQDPLTLAGRGAELFLPVLNPVVEYMGAVVADVPRDSILVNRSYIRRVKATLAM